MTETGCKFGLQHTAEQPLCRLGLSWLRPGWGISGLATLALSLGMQAWAQTQTPMGNAPAPAEQQASMPNSSMPASMNAVTDPSLPATPALGHSVQVPLTSSAANSSPAPDSIAWQSLSKRQKQALAPLSKEWHALTAQQRQKWLALSKNFLQLSDEEQMTLHSRMREWAALSPRQRSQARFHFNTTQSLSAQDKRAQWEAYQALSDQEKHKLSLGPKPPAKSAARSFATPSTRLVSPPLLPVNATREIQRVAPSKPIHPKTLLPQPS